MSWTQTLKLAQVLTKAIQANAKHEAAATPKPSTQETPMGDEAPATEYPVTPDALAPEPAPDPAVAPVDTTAPVAAALPATLPTTSPATSPTAAAPDINTTLQNAANLAQALHQNPEVLRFMHALLAKFGASLDKDI